MNKGDRKHILAVKEGPCVACIQRNIYNDPCEAHHLKDGDRRRGHRFTLGLCSWHHRGEPGNMTTKEATEVLGPSLAKGSRPFHAEFGSDDDLLEIQGAILDKLNSIGSITS